MQPLRPTGPAERVPSKSKKFRKSLLTHQEFEEYKIKKLPWAQQTDLIWEILPMKGNTQISRCQLNSKWLVTQMVIKYLVIKNMVSISLECILKV